MGNDSYFQTVAQVLPTLLIAVLIEFRFVAELLMRVAGTEEELRFAREPQPMPMITMAVGPVGKLYAAYVAACGTFVAGEVAALAATFSGVRGWLASALALVAGVGAIALVLLAVVTPTWHVFLLVRQVAAERDLQRLRHERALESTVEAYNRRHRRWPSRHHSSGSIQRRHAKMQSGVRLASRSGTG